VAIVIQGLDEVTSLEYTHTHTYIHTYIHTYPRAAAAAAGSEITL